MKGNRAGALSFHFSFPEPFKMKGNCIGALSLHFSFQNQFKQKGNRTGAPPLPENLNKINVFERIEPTV